jgi:DNA repair exonuclease SbcCD nuclease subunit
MHYDERAPRFEECVRVHSETVDLLRSEKADLLLIPGDVYERASTPIEREAVKEMLTRASETSTVVICRGNHDRPRDCAIWSGYGRKYPIIVEERIGVHEAAGAIIGAVAWPCPEVLLAQLRDQDTTDIALREALQNALRGIGAAMYGFDGPKILMGHFMIDGSIASKNQPMIGKPLNVGLNDLALSGASLGVYSHIHRAQHWDIGGAWHGYTGSGYRTDFGQTEPKSVLLAEFDGPRLVQTLEIETSAAKLEEFELTWNPELGFGETPIPLGSYENTEVSIKYNVARDQVERAERIVGELLEAVKAAGATQTKPQPVITVHQQAKAPEVAAAASLPDKLIEYWKAVKYEPGPRRQALLDKAHLLQQEVHAEL